jgi:metal-responsive CopG/Arc/MetJ family transcriptional regulator
MAAVRLNISLPEKTAKKLRKKVKPRERSAVIAEALDQYFKRDDAKSLIDEMIEGYIANREEDLKLEEEFNKTMMDGLKDETW